MRFFAFQPRTSPPSFYDYAADMRQATLSQVSTDKLSKVAFDELVLACQGRKATCILLRGPDKSVGTDLGSSHHHYAVLPLLGSSVSSCSSWQEAALQFVMTTPVARLAHMLALFAWCITKLHNNDQLWEQLHSLRRSSIEDFPSATHDVLLPLEGYVDHRYRCLMLKATHGILDGISARPHSIGRWLLSYALPFEIIEQRGQRLRSGTVSGVPLREIIPLRRMAENATEVNITFSATEWANFGDGLHGINNGATISIRHSAGPFLHGIVLNTVYGKKIKNRDGTQMTNYL